MLENLQVSFEPLSFLGMLITAFITLYIYKAGTPHSYLQERHEKLIFPLYNCLEPILYQDQNDTVLNEALLIIENNKAFIDGNLLNVYYEYKSFPSQNSFLDLCAYVDRAYDYSCRKLKLKCRPMEYRIKRKQYRDKRKLCLYILRWSLPSIISFVIFMSISLAFLTFSMNLIFSSNLGIVVILILFFLIATQLIDK